MTKKERKAALTARLQVAIAQVFNTCDEHSLAAARELVHACAPELDAAARWDYVEPIMGGEDTAEADLRSNTLALGILTGRTAAETIDKILEVRDGA